MTTLYDDAIRVLAEQIIKAEVSRYLEQCAAELTNQIPKEKRKAKKESLRVAARQISMLAKNIIPINR